MNTLKVRLTERSVISATRNQVSSDFLDGEIVILGLRDGIYYGLNPVGARIWQLIQEPRTVAELRDRLLEEYDVEPEQCTQELLALLEKLADRELVEVTESPE